MGHQLAAERLIRQRTWSMEGGQLITGVPGFYIVINDLGNPFLQMFCGLHIQGPQPDVELSLIGNDVDCCSSPATPQVRVTMRPDPLLL